MAIQFKAAEVPYHDLKGAQVGNERKFNTQVMLDFISETMHASTREEIMQSLEKAAVQYGMESFAISGIPLPNESIDPYFMLNGWPPEWFDRYVQENFVHIDPVIYQTKMSNDAFVWSEALEGKKLPIGARRVMDEATEFKMLDGFSVPLHGVSGFQAIVTFGAEKVDLSAEARGTLQIISIYAHNRLRALLDEQSENLRRLALQVSKRELEIILWCAAGKTNWEIGKILNISEKTVQHLLSGLNRKFNTVNRAQLIAEAFRTGLIR